MSTLLLALLFSRRRAPAREREEESKRTTTTRGEIPRRRRRRRQRGETFGARAFCPTKQRERELVRGDPRNRSSRRRRKPINTTTNVFPRATKKNVVLEPRHFGARMKDVIMEKIKLEVRPVCCMRSRVFSSHYLLLYFVSDSRWCNFRRRH